MYQSCTGNNPGPKLINFRTFMALETIPIKRYSAEIVSCKFYEIHPMIPRTLVSTPHICAGTTPPHGATTNHPAGSFCAYNLTNNARILYPPEGEKLFLFRVSPASKSSSVKHLSRLCIPHKTAQELQK